MSSANMTFPQQGAPAGGKRPPMGKQSNVGGGGMNLSGQRAPSYDGMGGPGIKSQWTPGPWPGTGNGQGGGQSNDMMLRFTPEQQADFRRRAAEKAADPRFANSPWAQNPTSLGGIFGGGGGLNVSQGQPAQQGALSPGYMESYLPGGQGDGGLNASIGGQPGGGGLGVATGGGSQPPGQPPATPPTNLGNDMIPWRPPGAPDPFSQPTSAMDVYRSAVPVMKQDLQDRLGDAMAGAGFTGNRFGSYAMKTAAEEGARTGLQQNQLMTNLLHRQTNTDLDRALQAANMGSQHGQAANQMQLDRMRFLADQGRFEQGRQDLFGRQRYEDFERNKLGFLPMLMQMAQSPGSPTAGVFGNQQSGGSPGLLDWATLAAQIYGASQ